MAEVVVTEVSGPDDPRVADYLRLTDAQHRRRHETAGSGMFVAEGVTVIRRVLEAGWRVRSALLAPARVDDLRDDLSKNASPVEVFVAPLPALEAITGFRLHRGAIAAVDRPTPRDWRAVARASLVLAVENVNDGENLGALFRNAAALGAGGVLVCPRTIDPLARRTVRVSMGQVCHVPFARTPELPGALTALAAAGSRVIALTPDGSRPLARTRPGTAPTVLVVGAEGPGVSPAARAACGESIAIPMSAGVDSLNVATAAAIALHHLGPASRSGSDGGSGPRPEP